MARAIFLVFIFLALLTACTSSPPLSANLTPVTAIPTVDPSDVAALCTQVDALWDTDWPGVIRVLGVLVEGDVDCTDGQPSSGMLYVAHYNYGRALQDAGQTAQATTQYQLALDVRPHGAEAMAALREIGVFTPMPLLTCLPDDVAMAREAVLAYIPSDMADFIQIEGSRFALGENEYVIQGVNYYPSRYPWRRFLTEADMDTARLELAMLEEVGFNTLRLFLWHDALFTCPGNGVVPVPDAFARLDAIIQEAAQRGFRLILTLNDMPDLIEYPLYESPPHTREQIAFLVERYRDEAAILAWDLRNEGDIDYEPVGNLGGGFTRDEVLEWLAETAALVRELDDQHLITAGWLRDAEATIPYVDFVSFHHWNDALQLRQRIASLRAHTDKPILLEEFGYSTYERDPLQQSQLLSEAIHVAEFDGLAGWLIWTAFDFPLDATCLPPACPSADSAEHHFGLWEADYTPKTAVAVLEVLVQAH